MLAHVVTASRVVFAFVVVLLYDVELPSRLAVALICYVLAEGTDHLDGFLARRLCTVSETGYVLDGLADRALYSAMLLVILRNHPNQVAIAWGLLFAHIALYAVRLLKRDWYRDRGRIRRLQLLHWTGLKLWTFTFALGDATRAFGWHVDPDVPSVGYLRTGLAGVALGFGYYALLLLVTSRDGPRQESGGQS
jgi:phosphatidylglycerophosphate synthase